MLSLWFWTVEALDSKPPPPQIPFILKKAAGPSDRACMEGLLSGQHREKWRGRACLLAVSAPIVNLKRENKHNQYVRYLQ